jgi:adenylosuccinate lyase
MGPTVQHPLSPLDGRYASSVDALRHWFSEEALFRARVEVELRYFIALSDVPVVRQLPKIGGAKRKVLLRIVERFSDRDVATIRRFEKTTKHDVKAVEYFLKEKLSRVPGMKKKSEFLHFGLTSEDVNNLAYGILIHEALADVLRPAMQSLVAELRSMGNRWKKVPMLSLTHGQPATPTTVGKEFLVFVERLERQLEELKRLRMHGKFGGAVGTFSAHKTAYPEVAWERFGERFVRSLGLIPLRYTTQINPHDDLAELSHVLVRINTILLNCSRDMWLYISRGVFKQRVVAGEVGSSTMPHKVNPIDFENAEGNMGLSTALFTHFAEKLPVSRLQRDLSDSTVQRNIGVAFGHHVLAVHALERGLRKLSLDTAAVRAELDAHPEVFAEAIQTVLRKHGVAGAYEKLKKLTRGAAVTKKQLIAFVKELPIPAGERKRLWLMLK